MARDCSCSGLQKTKSNKEGQRGHWVSIYPGVTTNPDANDDAGDLTALVPWYR